MPNPQEQIADLKARLQNARDDAERRELLSHLSQALFRIDPKEAKNLAQQACELAEALGDTQGLANSLSALGFAEYKNANYAKAIETLLRALHLQEQMGDEYGRAMTLHRLGSVYTETSAYTKAHEHLLQSLDIWRRRDDKEQIARGLNSMGMIYKCLGDYTKALNVYFESLDIRTVYGDAYDQAFTLNNIGNLYYRMNDHDAAMQYYQQCLDIRQEQNDQFGIAVTLGNISNIHLARFEYEQALDYAHRSLEIRETLGENYGKLLILRNIGLIYLRMEDQATALTYLQEGLKISRLMGNRKMEASILMTIGDITHKNNNLEEAIEILSQALTIAADISESMLEYDIHDLLASIYEHQQNSQQALHHYRRFTELRNEVMGRETKETIAALQLRHDIQSAEKEKEKLRRKLLESEHQTLRAQINPHFMFNSLNSIQYFLLRSEKESAHRYLTKFARLMRLIMNNSRFSLVSLREEIESLKLYLELEQLRFGERFTYTFTIDPDLDEMLVQIPPMVLQPYVENAIWHGLLSKERGGLLSISLEKESEEQILCIIEDNGIGREESQRRKTRKGRKHKSAGMSLIQERLRLIAQATNKEARVTIIDLKETQDQASGTRVEVLLPLTTEDDDWDD